MFDESEDSPETMKIVNLHISFLENDHQVKRTI